MFIVIKIVKDGMFIFDNVKNESYFNSKIDSFLFDGEVLVRIFKSGWYKLDKMLKFV